MVGNAHTHTYNHTHARLHFKLLLNNTSVDEEAGWHLTRILSPLPSTKLQPKKNPFSPVAMSIVASQFLTENIWRMQLFSCRICLESLFPTFLKQKESLILLQIFPMGSAGETSIGTLHHYTDQLQILNEHVNYSWLWGPECQLYIINQQMWIF